MHVRVLSLLLCCVISSFALDIDAAETVPYSGANCAAPIDHAFVNELWAKVAAQSCLNCHKAGGDAEESKLLLEDPLKSPASERDAVLLRNQAAFTRIAKVKEGEQYRVLLKVVGELDHGGEAVLKADTAGYRILADFVRRTNAPPGSPSVAIDANAPPFFQDVAMLDDRRLLRRTTLSLAGRLPTKAELEAIQQQGLQAMPELLDVVLKEEAFYDRLREAFNDSFLTLGYDDGAESALAYDHFSETRIWNQKHDLSHIADEKARQQARYKLADDYRAALLGEPMKLIEHIVRNDHPFTEIVTADYIMVTPYSARGYGIYEELK
ncbi:MAG TPA: DUF1592 domain-containing protein, partial [Pirellulaceae bacterium]|nr:DUF1592 domain-containing protein [Pirellulaceae bacterium]